MTPASTTVRGFAPADPGAPTPVTTSMRRLLTLLAMLAGLLLPGWAGATWNADWKHRVRVNLDTSASGVPLGAAVDNVPVLVRLHTGNFPFLDARTDGADLRFIAADDKTPLRFHIEKFDGVNELAFVWVQVPRLQPGTKDAHVWLYYGNEAAPAAGDAKGSFDAAQGLVYHFTDAQPLPQDASANGNHALRSSARPVTAALAGAGLGFDGGNELVIGASPSLRAGAGGFTVSMWIKPAETGEAVLLRQSEGSANLALLVRNGQLVAQVGAQATPPGGTLAAGTWQHVALVVGAGGQGLVVHLNGVAVTRGAFAVSPLGGQIVVGAGFKGELDELAVATAARSDDWIRLAAASQGQDAKLVAVAPAEAAGGDSHASYIQILLNAVTLDGWVVIALCGVMFVVSVAVMVSKFLMVSRMARDNERFMQHFARLMDEVRPGQGRPEREQAERQVQGHHGGSPLYRLYAAALHEMHERFDAYQRNGQALTLNAGALSAIKATLDARMVRELQRMNSRLVVLTVAIAGGPFLGLLGTVVGVMITFAAIAAAGDVNVNAIAPGIAAALVATVAGLGVAIPNLFGYNFLTTRIGELTADLQAFVDELITRIAEKHAA